MTTSHSTYLRPLAVVDEPAGKICIWHVDVGPDIGLSRLSGAWVLERDDTDKLHVLTKDRFIVRCAATDLIEREGIRIAGVVDVDATVSAVRAERDQLQDRFDSHAATHKALVVPTWPDIVHPEDVAASVKRSGIIAERTGHAFPLARGLNELAEAWAQIEKQRLARKFLINPVGSGTRPLPIECHKTP